MTEKRSEDAIPYNKYRTNRFCKEGGLWYFLTREGTMEGPFDFKLAAENRLEVYIKVVTSGLIAKDCKLSVEPLTDPALKNYTISP